MSSTAPDPSCLLLFIDCEGVADSSEAIPALGVHALSAYLRRHGFTTSAWQMVSAVTKAEAGLVCAAVAESAETRSRFEQDPDAFLKALAAARLDLAASASHLRLFLMSMASLVERERASVVGLTLYRANIAVAVFVAAQIRARYPDVEIIMGGPEVNERTIGPLLAAPFVDAVIEGEGEQALLAYMRAKADERSARHPRIHTEDAPPKRGGAPAPQLALPGLPPPDFDALPARRKTGILPVEFNRGCIANCSFCEETRFWKTYRQTSVEGAIATLAHLKERYGATRFYLSQSLMNGDVKWLTAFSEAMIEANLGVTWGGNARIDKRMDRAYFTMMHRAGCRYISYGVESGSQEILRSMKKGVRTEVIPRVLNDAAAAGIFNHTFWIFGFPGERLENLLATTAFIERHADVIHSHQYHFYGDADAIGTEHPDIYAYVGAMKRQFTRLSEDVAPHARGLERLFAGERRLARLAKTASATLMRRAFDDEMAVMREEYRWPYSVALRQATMRAMRDQLEGRIDFTNGDVPSIMALLDPAQTAAAACGAA